MKKVKKNLPADQRRAVTVEAVIQLAAEKNPSTITTAEIAARMNLTQGALFRHFPTKDALWQSVMEWISVRLLGDVDEVIGKANSPMEVLELMFIGIVQGLVMQSLIAGDTSVMLSNAKPVFALYCQAIKKK